MGQRKKSSSGLWNFVSLRRAAPISAAMVLLSSVMGYSQVTVDFRSNNISADNPEGEWHDRVSENKYRSIRFENNTALPYPSWGVRVSFPEEAVLKSGVQSPDLDWVSDKNRYDLVSGSQFAAAEYDKSTSQWNPEVRGFSVKGGTNTPWGQKGPNWAPLDYSAQILAQTRSFADMADFIDANPVRIDELDAIISNPEFYDADLYVSDTLGQNAPLYGAGFIDTYINQEDSTPITQVQMNEFPEDKFIKLSNGIWVKYRPDLMGQNDNVKGKGEDNKAGPLYSMGLVAAQELMHIDQQFLAPMGIIETQAAFEAYGDMGGKPAATGKMTHIQKNDFSTGMGPMHMEGTGFGEKAIGSYPEYFPFANGSYPDQWFTTPGTESAGNALGSCAGNSAQIVNATMIATLYCWRGYEQLFRATDFYAKGIFEEAADRKLAAKLYMWGWQGGFSSQKGGTYSGPMYWDSITTIKDVTPYCSPLSFYVQKVTPALDGILDAQKNSVLNGGNTKVIDMPISLEYLAEFFFGNDTPPYNSIGFAESGELGKGGLLQHYPLTKDERLSLWGDITTAFEKMKGKAPSGYSDAVSFRYDWLTILRIAKGYIYPQMFDIPYKPVMLRTPTDVVFKNWVKVHSTEYNIPGVEERDNTYPSLLVKDIEILDNEDFVVSIRGGDNSSIDIEDPAAVEWTIDSTWNIWYPSEFVDGTEKDANFKVTIPAATYKTAFGEKDGRGWVRVTDRSGNSTIESVVIGGVKHPKIDSVYIVDTVGDGSGYAIRVHLKQGGADDADALESWEILNYSWPDKTPLNSADRANTSIENSILTITEDFGTAGAGLGVLNMDYPSKKGYVNDILDRIGPAIRLAALDLNEPRNMDTLLLTVNESLVLGSKTDVPYLILKKGTVETKISADEAIKVSDLEYQFVFDKSKNVLDQDSVKFEFEGNSTVEDAVGNTPLNINQWVHISRNGDKAPTVETAEIFDIDGDGDGDSIRVVLNKGSNPEHYVVSDIDSVDYIWPIPSKMVNTKAVGEISPYEFTFLVDTSVAGAGFGEGSLQIVFPENAVVPGTIADKVGAALQDSLYFDNSARDRQKDTLYIRVTEDIDFAQIENNKVYLQFAETKDGTVADVVSESFVHKSGDTIVTLVEQGTLDNNPYNWVRLAHNNGALDLAGNIPHVNSQWVPIARTGSETVLDSALVFDTDGDGFGNTVTLHATAGTDPKAVSLLDASKAFYRWPNSNDMTETTLLDTGSIYFDVDTSRFVAGEGTGYVELNFNDNFYFSTDILDRVGPALHDSAYFDVSFKDRKEDTLRIRVTESLDFSKIESDKVYLQFAETKDGSIDDISSITFVAGTDDTVLTTVAKETIENSAYNWVRLAANGVVDAEGNGAHETSKWVPLVRKGDESSLNSAAAFDTDGDGYSNEIRINYSQGTDPEALDFSTVTEVFYKWTNEKEFASAELKSDNGKFSIEIDTAEFKFGAGEGTVEFRFADTTLSVTVADSTGPAMRTAKRLFSEKKIEDTVVVALTEELNNNFDENATYFTIVRGSDLLDTESKSVKKSGEQLEIIFDYGTILENDSICFIPESGVKDVATNIPHVNNIRIPIELIGGKRPTFTEGTLYDIDGDGVADSIYATITLGTHKTPDLAGDLLTGEYSWPEQGNLETLDGFKVLSDTTLSFTGFENSATAGDGEISLTFPNGIVNGELTDRVGAVIVKAELWEKMGGDDTLQITFSEEITGITHDDFVINVNGDAKQSPIVERFKGKMTWLFSFENGTVELGDMVNIVSASSLEDMAGNSAHPNNIEVEVTMKKRPIGTVNDRSYFKDSDVDGTLDLIEIELVKEVDDDRIQDFKLTFTWLDENGDVDSFTVNDTAMTAHGSTIAIDVSELKLFGDMTFVGADFGDVSLLQPDSDLPDGELHKTELKPKDAMAPILIGTAGYRGKKLTSDEERFHDTLVLTFSEEIVRVDNEFTSLIYDLKDERDSFYKIRTGKEVKRDGNRVTFVVEVLRDESTIPGSYDEIRIAGNGAIEDLVGNGQREKTPFVPFSAVYIPAGYDIVVYPNPFKIGSGEMNPLIEKYSDDGSSTKGRVAIMVRPFGNRAADDLAGTITVIDQVGNIVLERTDLEYQTRSKVLLFTADGTNNGGRELGSGQYLVWLNVDNGGDITRHPVMLGVQK